jgi:hypothetical protein
MYRGLVNNAYSIVAEGFQAGGASPVDFAETVVKEMTVDAKEQCQPMAAFVLRMKVTAILLDPNEPVHCASLS